ncbi:MAG TPA: diaminopimelate dehydrogenase [Pseudogracilibacillus sp.]|nr:diaminopimelate dehydrogenase [Pseudogracilibacillus sp.]
MTNKIKVGIIGYGNLGRGAEAAIQQQSDMELVGIFSRRGEIDIQDKNAKALHIDEAEKYQGEIDVMILCGGSATDLPEQTPHFTKLFNTVDSFDTHATIPEHFAKVDETAQESGNISVISVGWDPGMFSMNRVMSEAILAEGNTYTFWGKGLSQGHSDAVRRVDGVKAGVQYTLPSEEVMEQVRQGENPEASKSERHKRECYVVLEAGADAAVVEDTIKTMPNYFDEYDTTVYFISEDELNENHSTMPHGGFVIHSGSTGEDKHNQVIEYSLNLESNPEFTASVLVAYARAAHRLSKEGQKGAKTIYDIGPGYIHPASPAALRKGYL